MAEKFSEVSQLFPHFAEKSSRPVFIRPSLRQDVLWYTNVRPSVSHGQFTSDFTELLELMVFMVKFRIFIPELWDFIHQIVGDFSYVAL
jgi:hypothetical protein